MRHQLARAAGAYLLEGGFPAAQGQDADIRRTVLQEYADTRVRELRGLADAACLHQRATRTIVTFEDEGEVDGVRIVPLWRWLLENERS